MKAMLHALYHRPNDYVASARRGPTLLRWRPIKVAESGQPSAGADDRTAVSHHRPLSGSERIDDQDCAPSRVGDGIGDAPEDAPHTLHSLITHDD
jgi:hypothetical protein